MVPTGNLLVSKYYLDILISLLLNFQNTSTFTFEFEVLVRLKDSKVLAESPWNYYLDIDFLCFWTFVYKSLKRISKGQWKLPVVEVIKTFVVKSWPCYCYIMKASNIVIVHVNELNRNGHKCAKHIRCFIIYMNIYE